MTEYDSDESIPLFGSLCNWDRGVYKVDHSIRIFPILNLLCNRLPSFNQSKWGKTIPLLVTIYWPSALSGIKNLHSTLRPKKRKGRTYWRRASLPFSHYLIPSSSNPYLRRPTWSLELSVDPKPRSQRFRISIHPSTLLPPLLFY